MLIEPDEQLLFATSVIARGYASPARVAAAATACLGQGGVSLADRLEADGVISAVQRREIEAEIDKMLSDQLGTVGAAAAPLEGDQTQVEPTASVDDTIGAVTPEQPGRYTIQGVHGRGGQARVLLASDAHIGRDVALKELLPDRAEGESTSPWASPHSIPGVVRFLREARVTGQLEHPNIVPVYEVGRRKDGTLYYTMRLVRGQTMAQKLSACRDLQDRMKLLGAFWDICKAISYAHSRGVVHRDIKPSNVMVGEFGETVLLDWGIAKVRGKRDIGARDIKKELMILQDENVERTTAGAAMGTPSYMSPEQAKGEIGEIDERSDVWGLGAVLYEILTGHPPFEGKRRAEILLKVGRKPIKPVIEQCAAAPAELAAVAQKALHRDKTRRYQSARELTDDIGAYMTGEKVTAYEYSSWELLKRFASLHKPIIVAVAVILGVMIGALVSVSLSLQAESQARQSESLARKKEQTARAKEHTERLVANYHLSEAYAEKADRLTEDKRFLSANLFSAASLLHNPAHPKSPYHDSGFEKRFPRSHELRVDAASQVYRASFYLRASLARSLAASEVLTRVAYAPVGDMFAAGSYDGSIHVWNSAGKQLFTLRGHKDRIYDVAFSPDGKLLASAGHDGTVRLWDAGSGSPLLTLRGHTSQVQGVAFSPNGRLLASASYDGTVRIWGVGSGKTRAVLSKHIGKVNAVTFSPDGKLLASAGDDRTLRLWKMPRAKPLAVLRGHAAEVYCVAFSPDGRLLASAGNDRNVRLWRVRSRKTVQVLAGHTDGILSLNFSPDSRRLATASYDQTARIWEVASGRLLLTIGHRGFVYGAAFSAQGSALVTSGYDKVARLWQLVPGRKLLTIKGHRGTVYALVISTDGKLLASAGWDKSVRVWSLPDGSPRAVLAGHTDIIDGLAFSRDGKSLASSGRDKIVHVWDMRRLKARLVLRGHTGAVFGVAFSPEGSMLASSSRDRTIGLWDAEAGKRLATLRGHKNDVDNIEFSPDGKWLASASWDKTVRIWDVHTGEQLRVLGGHSDWTSGLSFSHRGDALASAGKDGLAIVWDCGSWREKGRLVGHEQWVNSVRFSPDDSLLATASDDHSVRLWSSSTFKPLLKIDASSEVVAIGFSPDGKLLVMGDGNDVKIYPVDFSALDMDPEKLISEAEKSAGMKLDGFKLSPIQSAESR